MIMEQYALSVDNAFFFTCAISGQIPDFQN